MDFQQLLSRMAELDQPATEAIVPECGDPMIGGMTPPMADKPAVPEPSMSLNLNAQGMDNIESLMKLMTKVNPDMINQPDGGMPPMPSLTPPGPSISSIGDLGNLDAGPLKMLPDLDNNKDSDHAEPDADNMGGPSDNDADNKIDIVKLNKKEEESSEEDEDDIMTHLNKELKPYDDQVAKDKEKDEAFGNSVAGSEPEYMDTTAAILDGDDLHKQKSMHRAAAGGDNPMKAEGTDLRAQIRAELQQRLAEAKGAK
jgi:hypothetical protein